MKTEYLLEVEGFSLREAGRYILRDVSFRILPGECWVFTGKSGTGKSTMLRSIANHKMFSGNIRFGTNAAPTVRLIGHQHRFQSFSGVSDFYYQQRFNATESGDSDTVINDLLAVKNDDAFARTCLKMLQIDHLADSPMIWLSNGEHKRFQIAKALFENAEWLLLDDPYTGLDAQTRTLLNQILATLISGNIRILLVSGREIPAFATHVAVLDNGMITGIHSRKNFLQERKSEPLSGKKMKDFDFLSPVKADFDFAVKMNSVSVVYNGRKVLADISWNVRRGEKWCICGHNGSGKSTLLSLITADNPQAFANDIYLFDRKKGSGETIWEIKSRIGYVSPELHQYFDKSASCFKVIASGLFDTIGLFRKLKQEQVVEVNRFLELFELRDVSEKSLGSLSHGMQRWVLLARALIKNPSLIVLDEPCQGLDSAMCEQFVAFIDHFCTGNQDRTLLYVTHVDEEIPACIDNIIKLRDGKIIEISNHNEKGYYSHSGRRDRA